MHLSELPAEVLLNIGTQLGDDGLSRLLRTNRWFHNFFGDEIYKMHVQRTKGIALLWAANRGDEMLVRTFLDCGANPNVGWGPRVPGQGDWALRTAARSDLYWRPDGNRTHLTPLTLAAQKGYLDIVKLLLAYGADPGRHNREHQTACLAAITALIEKAHDGRQYHNAWDRLSNFNQPRRPLDPQLLAVVDFLIHLPDAMYGTHGYRVLNLALQWPDQDLAVYMLRDEQLQASFCEQPGSQFEHLLRHAALYHRVAFVDHLLDVAYANFHVHEWGRLALIARDATQEYFSHAMGHYFLMYKYVAFFLFLCVWICVWVYVSWWWL
ncbi:hypothetical protein ASPACDRAFT_47653 [Aspergillus aculeatus ATCC 16872]|uniref:Uncharacterized protein n=1 Tax=Aspergillus aculeatus (strain ATCC 16872 / CBS 172.66 / WB 5094) TaxID=690307 RepID=A0A1L9WHW0_ASPA1|nr:uncharacterized protein ASPACDRAFT_47653 [Aspergillus aculeatus ATCC 16872]OJJ95762.1 hypothetical protein ASPACDRAFT_47653 [Aspergillus aculeatus ATCC 16872]